jgi:hypothetical protein
MLPEQKDLTGFEKPVRSYHKIENGINFRREDLTVLNDKFVSY